MTEKKRMKRLLRRTRERMKASLETGLAGTFYWDIQGDLVITDENITHYFSLPETAITEGVPISHVLPAIFESDRTRARRSLMLAIKNAAGYREEFRIRLPTGDIRWISARSTIMRDPNGEAIGLSGLIMDITERKMAEEALRESEARLAAEVQMMRDLYYSSNRLLAATDLGTALKEVLAFAVQLLDADFADFQLYNETTGLLELAAQQGIDAAFITAFREVNRAENTIYSRAIRHGKRIVVEDVGQSETADSDRDVAIAVGFRALQATPLFDNKGNLLGVLATYFRKPQRPAEEKLIKLDLYIRQAISFIGRMRAEDALSRSEENYRVIVNQSIAGILKVDFSDNIVFSNQRFSEMVGYSIRELMQLTVSDITHPEDNIENTRLFKKLINEGKAYEIEKRLICKDSSVIWVNNQISPILDQMKRPSSAVIICVDITRQKATEKQKDEFIGVASHELKTPLTGIKAYGQLLGKEFRNIGAEESAALITKLNGQIDRMVKLVYALLDTTMISGGKLALQKELFDLDVLIREKIHEARQLGPNHRFTYQPCTLPEVTADRERIGQVLTNLITNAIKYSQEGSEVLVSCESSPKDVTVRVRDWGIGVSDAAQDRVFERFYRVEDASSAPIQGVGLGLYIAAEIIKKHGGSIGVESNLGEGSVFYFTLPY